MSRWKKLSAMLLAVCLGTGALAGCGSGDSGKAETQETETGKKTFVFGDTTFNPENEEPNVRRCSAIPTLWKLNLGWQKAMKMSMNLPGRLLFRTM